MMLSIVSAQQADRIPSRLIMSPVPFLTTDAHNKVLSDKKQSAFFDSKRNQLVLFVANLSDGPLEERRYDIPNATRANLNSSVATSDGKIFHYTFSLTDHPQTPQAAARLALFLPGSDNTLECTVARWAFTRQPTDIGDRVSAVHGGKMAYAVWEYSAKSPAAFQQAVLRSTYKPGFADAYVSGRVAKPLTSDGLAGLSPELVQQVQDFLTPGIGSNHHLVIAPIFRPGLSKEVIAANFHYGISVLMNNGSLARDSAYSRELLNNLSAFLGEQGLGAGIATPVAKPATALEVSIQQAAAISLH
ncbi:MAG: hypothetical protein HYX27_06245 [Acidobacteria bacterium]|nr:hypothetical protein [Acidobacteriota bacterium]